MDEFKDARETISVIVEEGSSMDTAISTENTNGRYDDLGNFIESIEDFPHVFNKLMKFSTQKKLSKKS